MVRSFMWLLTCHFSPLLAARPWVILMPFPQRYAGSHTPMILTGKPSLHALRLVAKRLGIPMTRIGVVGDDPLVEMIMARRGGAVGFGVITGISKAHDWAKQPQGRRPHRVLRRLGELLDAPGICNH